VEFSWGEKKSVVVLLFCPLSPSPSVLSPSPSLLSSFTISSVLFQSFSSFILVIPNSPSYQAIEFGNIADALVDLTGEVREFIHIKNNDEC
jgi:hypothetical protein